MGGLADNSKYFVRVDDNKLTLYDTKAHAQAGGSSGKINLVAGGTGSGHRLEHSDGLVNLTSVGTGEGHSLTPTGFDLKVSAVSIGGGVSQQGSGVAGSLAVEVFVDHTHATIADNAQINQRGLYTPTANQDVVVQATDLTNFDDFTFRASLCSSELWGIFAQRQMRAPAMVIASVGRESTPQ